MQLLNYEYVSYTASSMTVFRRYDKSKLAKRKIMETVDYFPIEVEQTSWQVSSEVLTAIRYQVFVDEQQVPISEEIDDDDMNAVHWLAYGPDDVAMATGRMLGHGQVGRMAVLKEFRDQGVGSSLMRHMIRYAITEGMEQLQLNAQIKAIPFYENFGFVAEGDPFMDAGIPHKIMHLNLHNYIDHSPHPSLPTISDAERLRNSIDDVDTFRDYAEKLIQRAERDIRIFSQRLDAALYSNKQFCDAIYTFATNHPSAQVKILVKDLFHVIHHPNQLHELCRRLPSRIQIKKFDSKEACLHSEFMVIDKAGILYKQEPERYVGYATLHAPLETAALVEEFEALWNDGKVDPELRRLHI